MKKELTVVVRECQRGADSTSSAVSSNELHYDLACLSSRKRKRSVLSVIAQHARLGNITEASLVCIIAGFVGGVNRLM